MNTTMPTLADQYRTAVLDRSVPHTEYLARLDRIEQAIFKALGSQEQGQRYIAAITSAIDHATDVDQGRGDLQKALQDAESAHNALRAALARLSSDGVYDVEIAEGDTEAMTAALVGMRVHLAALRHLTRDAV
jgi:hypothetical protein